MLYRVIKPLLFRLDAERAHELVTGLLGAAGRLRLPAALIRALHAYDDPILATTFAGLRFANPVGLAAGFDKRAALVGPMALLGFGHVEVGTVTPRPQTGNPRPRLFRLPEDEALINRLGFNSPGMVAVARRLRNRRSYGRGLTPQTSDLIVGVNIGKNRDTPLERAAEDYLAAFAALAPLADYVAVNISSPNTPGLRQLHERAALEELIAALAGANRLLPRPLPLLLKVSPDEGEERMAEVVRAGVEGGVAGFIATNTTLGRAGLRGASAAEQGGLSGRPLARAAERTVAQIYALTDGRAPVIGVGGVDTAEAAYARIRAGATLVQLYTGLVYRGSGVAREIKRGLAALLRRDGFRSVAEAVGVSARARGA